MPSTDRRPDWTSDRALITWVIRSHRVAIGAWVLGGTAVMVGMSVALAKELADFPGGPRALALSVMPGAEAMRPLRWPAERLDTLGGYLTYHNITLFAFFLTLYAAVQGTRAIRGAEERTVLEEVLATGVSRTRVVRDVSIGFALVLAIISTLLGLGVALAMQAGGEPDVSGSLVAMASTGLCAFVGFGLGLLISQFTATSRSAAGISALILVALYLASTTIDPQDAGSFLAWASPFWWNNKSRTLVPGQTLDPAAIIVLASGSVLLMALAGWAFAHRDYQQPLWHPPRHRVAQTTWRPSPAQRWALGSVWSATLLRSRLGLVAWIAAAAGFTALMVSLSTRILDLWANFSFLQSTFEGRPISAEAQYMSFSAEIVGPVVAAYVVVQAAGWISDADAGRLDMIRSTPRSPTRVVLERVVAAGSGTALIAIAALAALVGYAGALHLEVSWPGVLRTFAVTVAFGVAIAGISAVLVAVLPSTGAITAMAAILTAMYLLDYMISMLGWPDWLHRLSLFWAYAHPYLGWPTAIQFGVLAVAALGGTALACWLMTPRTVTLRRFSAAPGERPA